jgi:hypothetical protein
MTPGARGTAETVSNIESRAREILGLQDLEEAPHALPIRVERMWRAENFAPNVPYTGAVLIPMGRTPDMGAWREAIAAVARRHDALHSRLAVVKDRAIMVPGDPKITDLEMVTVSRFDIENLNRRPSALSEFFGTPIHLFEEIGFRCRTFQDEDGNFTLGILMHHYFGDAWSSQILRREIETAQAVITRGAAPELPPVVQYSEYALSQRRFLAKNLPGQLGYWHQRLAAALPAALPFDCNDDSSQLGRAAFSVPLKTLEKLALLSRSERISLPMVCLAAFQLTLGQWCGQKHALTAVTSADRMKPQFRDTIGRLMSGIPLYSDFSQDQPIRIFLAALAKEFYSALAHRDLAFEQYDEIYSPPAPFCTTRFNFIPHQPDFSAGGTGAGRPEFAGILKLANIPKAATYRDLHFLLMQYPDGLVGRVIYNLNFSFDKIESFIGIFGRMLNKIADNPDGKLSELL